MSVATNKDRPKVSILIPTYNRADYLRGTIKSVIAQTYQNIQVLVLDDASSDHTSSVMAEFTEEPRLIYVRNETNLGMAGNWKAAIAAADGEFFCLLNDDDTMEPEFVASLLEPMLNDHKLVLAACDHWIMDSEGVRQMAASEQSTNQARSGLAEGRMQNFAYSAIVDRSLYIGAALFRRSLVGPNCIDERARGFADAWLFYQCVKTGYSAYYIPRRLMDYRVHSGGMSRTQAWRPYLTEGNLFWFQQMLADPDVAAIHGYIREQSATVLINHGLGLLEAGKHREAYQALGESWQLKKSGTALLGRSLAASGFLGTATLLMLKNLRNQVRKAQGSIVN